MSLSSHFSPRTRIRKFNSISVIVAVLTALTAVAMVAAQSDLETPSPAKGTVQVISQGMSARPDLRSAWRVVEREIPIRADARPSNRLEGSAGFLLADETPIFVTDQDTKLRYRLGSGEALYVPIGANQTWASLDDQVSTAYSLELAVRETIEEVGAGEVIYNSGSFGMAEGDYDLDLLRDVLPNNKHSTIEGTDFPILLFVTKGQIEIDSNKKGVKTQIISEGEATSVEGDLDIRTRSKGDATYVAVVVGGSIGGGRTSTKATATPTEEPTATPEPTETPEPEATKKPKKEKTPEPTEIPESRSGTAELKLEIRLCPAGMRPSNLNGDLCKAANGDFSLALVTPFGDSLRLRDANRYDENYVRWSNLKSGIYELQVRKIPDGYDLSSLDGFLCCPRGDGYKIVLGRGERVYGTLYFFRPA